MTTKLAPALALLFAGTACPIAETDVGAFGAPCSSTCATGFTCDATAGLCVPVSVASAEGEAGEGEGEGTPSEGEGAPSEGEGEGTPSEGEGTPSEGEGTVGEGEGTPSEGEGAPSEGEGGEGEGTEFCTDTGTACDCGLARVCYAGEYCGPPLPACDAPDTCGLTECTTDGTALFVSCDNGLCSGVAPHLVMRVTWQGGADIDVHLGKRDALGQYCMDNFVDETNFGGPAGTKVCDDGAPLDCWHNSCSAFNLAETFVHWGPSVDEIPSYASLVDAVTDPAGVLIAINELPPGDYVAGGFFRSTGQGDDPTDVTVDVEDAFAGTTLKTFSFSIGESQWKEFLHVHVDAEDDVQCIANLFVTSERNACPP